MSFNLTIFVIRLQHAWAVLRRDNARAQVLLEILIMIDTTTLKANASAALSALASTRADLASANATNADLTAKLAAATSDEAAGQSDVNSVADQLGAAVTAAG